MPPTLPTNSAPATTVMPARDAGLRLNDFYEVYAQADPEAAQRESGRCMNCGSAFCMPGSGYETSSTLGCPIGNKIPEWNELVRLGRWQDAYERLSETNPFPEFTSRVCPAPCQDACIVGINESPIQIKGIERAIIDRAFSEGWVKPITPPNPTGRRVAIVGSGPAGLAAADRLIRLGHAVTVYERADRAGGLLTYGVPNMKLDKSVVERRIDLLRDSGVRFELNADVGGSLRVQHLLQDNDVMLLAVGAQHARELELPGRSLKGVRLAMDYLTDATCELLGDAPTKGSDRLDARDQHVVVIGGGDTGADCLGTALRQGCKSLTNITRRELPPNERDAAHAWPGPTGTYVLDYAHAEGQAHFGQDPRSFQLQPLAFIENPEAPGHVCGVEVKHLGTRQTKVLPADLVLLAIGFVGHDAPQLNDALSTQPEESQGANPYRTANPNIYTAGDCRRGASLVVWAIHEGLAAADTIHADLLLNAPATTPLASY